jgi:hypothetical protein
MLGSFWREVEVNRNPPKKKVEEKKKKISTGEVNAIYTVWAVFCHPFVNFIYVSALSYAQFLGPIRITPLWKLQLANRPQLTKFLCFLHHKHALLVTRGKISVLTELLFTFILKKPGFLWIFRTTGLLFVLGNLTLFLSVWGCSVGHNCGAILGLATRRLNLLLVLVFLTNREFVLFHVLVQKEEDRFSHQSSYKASFFCSLIDLC